MKLVVVKQYQRDGFYRETITSPTQAAIDAEITRGVRTLFTLSDGSILAYYGIFDNSGGLVEQGFNPALEADGITKFTTETTSAGLKIDRTVYMSTPAAGATYTLPTGYKFDELYIANVGTGLLTVSLLAGATDTFSTITVLPGGAVTLSYTPPDATWRVKLATDAFSKTITKTADQTVANSSTLTNDNALAFNMFANTKYHIRLRVWFDTTAAGDFKYGFTGPAAPTRVRHDIRSDIPGAAGTIGTGGVAYPSGVSLTGTGTTGGWLECEFVVTNGSTAGNFQFQFAQNTLTNDTGAVVLAGSKLTYSIIQ